MHKERKFSLSCYRFWHSCPSDLHPNNLQGYSENLNRYGFSWSWRSYCFFEKSAHCALFSGHPRPRTAAPTYSAGFPVGRTNVNPENHATGRRPAGSRQSHAVHAGDQRSATRHTRLLVLLPLTGTTRLNIRHRRPGTGRVPTSYIYT